MIHTKEQRELMGLPAARVRLRRRHAKTAAIALMFLATIAATSRITLDINRWRDAGATARAVAADYSRPDKERVDAMAVMCRDARATILLLRTIGAGQGAAPEHARNYLAGVQAALAEPIGDGK